MDVMEAVKAQINNGASRAGKFIPLCAYVNPRSVEYNFIRIPRKLKKKLKLIGKLPVKTIVGFKKL